MTSVDVRTVQGALLQLSLDDISSGIVVSEIEGLDPVKAVLVSSNFAHTDGEEFHTARRVPRNIKIKLELDPDQIFTTVRDLRRKLYDYFMPKSEIVLVFNSSDMPSLEILGVVESLETPLFTKEPEIDISIMCFNPDFVDTTPVVVNGNTVSTNTDRTIGYVGTAETGFLLTFRPNRALNEFTVYHSPPDGTLRSLEFQYPLLAGDILEISTRFGQKGAWLTRANIRSSALYGISPRSSWLELLPGDNKLRVYAEGAAIPYSIEYTTKYGGL